MRSPKLVLALTLFLVVAPIPGCGPPDPVETVREYARSAKGNSLPPIDRFERLEDHDGSQRVRGHAGRESWDFFVRDGKVVNVHDPKLKGALEAVKELERMPSPR